ncbi:hypothetical protein AXF42_Ash013225 [Apostasia shenzhenica]|uniref:Uncharacterized protein n=1 Tax=Apostasia shenzhenica TaxID=1088818 RepID=A0A2I0BBC7_9ASPA|nr:hypothetical protein AXF42_Ash013225 [Apostasia shenzhenica]
MRVSRSDVDYGGRRLRRSSRSHVDRRHLRRPSAPDNGVHQFDRRSQTSSPRRRRSKRRSLVGTAQARMDRPTAPRTSQKPEKKKYKK